MDSRLAVMLRDLSGAIKGVRGQLGSLEARLNALEKAKEKEKEIPISPFYPLGPMMAPSEKYTLDWTVLVFKVTLEVGETHPVINAIPSGTMFWLRKITSKHDGPYRVQIFDSQSGRNLVADNQWVHVDNIAGDAKMPYMLEGHRVYQSQTKIRIDFQNLHTDKNEIEFVMHGILYIFGAGS